MLRIVGDTCFADGDFDQGFGLGQLVKDKGNPFINIPIQSSDFLFGNLECVISDKTETKGNQNSFRIEKDAVMHFTHFDLYSVANNHTMQHGPEAFNSTLKTVDSISQFVGSNNRKYTIIDHNGSTYGIVAFSLRQEVFFTPPLYWCNPEYKDIIAAYQAIEKADYKIVYMHWGNEFINYPNTAQKKLARWLIDIGYDLVVGSHPHVLQGYEVYNGKHIFYSLGNFVFNMSSPSTQYSVIINIDIHNTPPITYDYVHITNGIPSIVSKSDVPERYQFEYLNPLINIQQDNEVYYRRMFTELSKYQKINRRWILKTLHKHKPSELYTMISSFINRRIYK